MHQQSAALSQWPRRDGGSPPFRPEAVRLFFLAKSNGKLLWKHFGLADVSSRELLAGALLFFLPHPLPQLLADVGQGVHLGREGLCCLAEADGLRFPAGRGKNTGDGTVSATGCLRDRTAEEEEQERLLTGICVCATVSSG